MTPTSVTIALSATRPGAVPPPSGAVVAGVSLPPGFHAMPH